MSEPTSRTAIVVDDNLIFAMMVEAGLKQSGYAPRTLSGGPATVDQVQAAAPDLVFVNLSSTRFDAPALIRDLRAQAALAGTGIVGYAGHVERDKMQAGRDAGAHLVAPNSALRKAMPEVLAKLARQRAGAATEEWPDD
jgi:CheY-like chemotaxis protein